MKTKELLRMIAMLEGLVAMMEAMGFSAEAEMEIGDWAGFISYVISKDGKELHSRFYDSDLRLAEMARIAAEKFHNEAEPV
jgi:hypothetical protein